MLKLIKKLIILIKEGHPNSYRYQRNWAKRYINSKDDLYSDSWGKIDCYNLGLGDYSKISKDISTIANPYPKEVIDLGCLDGKWSIELAKYFHKVHCVDLTDELQSLLATKLKDKMGIFYKTRGNELRGFGEESIDLIFSMDSLVRCPLSDIKNYFKDFFRILRGGGQFIYIYPVMKNQGVSLKDLLQFQLLKLKPYFLKLVL